MVFVGEFFRRQGSHGERMDMRREFLAEEIIHDPLSSDAGKTVKLKGNDQQAEMRLAARARPGMSGVEVGLILHLKLLRRQSRPDPRFDPICDTHPQNPHFF